MLAMLNPGLVCDRAQVEKRKSRKMDRTLEFYYPYLRRGPNNQNRSFGAFEFRNPNGIPPKFVANQRKSESAVTITNQDVNGLRKQLSQTTDKFRGKIGVKKKFQLERGSRPAWEA
jgi:hypothetical protein